MAGVCGGIYSMACVYRIVSRLKKILAQVSVRIRTHFFFHAPRDGHASEKRVCKKVSSYDSRPSRTTPHARLGPASAGAAAALPLPHTGERILDAEVSRGPEIAPLGQRGDERGSPRGDPPQRPKCHEAKKRPSTSICPRRYAGRARPSPAC